MKMPTIRRMWTFYKHIVLQEGLGIRHRNQEQVLAQNAFYLGAQTTLQALLAVRHTDPFELYFFCLPVVKLETDAHIPATFERRTA